MITGDGMEWDGRGTVGNGMKVNDKFNHASQIEVPLCECPHAVTSLRNPIRGKYVVKYLRVVADEKRQMLSFFAYTLLNY